MDRPQFTEKEENNLRRRLNITVSEWAAANRYLPAGITNFPGRWRNELTPYGVGIMDATHEPDVEEIVLLKCTQGGGSEFLRNIIGYQIDVDPGPSMLVMPSDKSGREMIGERIRPLLSYSPALRRHLSPVVADNTKDVIHLDTMSLYLATAGSPQSLASRPCRYVFFDEVDKYPPFSGREADPISLGTERAATFMWRKRIFKISTPTTRNGPIWQAWLGCSDRRYYHVPCPSCGKFQRLVWTRVKWPKLAIEDRVKFADEIDAGQLAWYECERCNGRIEEGSKPKILLRGVWASETQTVNDDGVLIGDRPRTKRVGFHLSALYTPWRKFWEMASEFIRAENNVAATMDFRNSRLAEPFDIQVSTIRPSQIRDKSERMKAANRPAGIIPAWAKLLIATADTQQDSFYYVIRAWGYGYRSQLIDHGRVATFDDLYDHCVTRTWPIEGQTMVVPPKYLLIDSGGGREKKSPISRTSEVYQFCLRAVNRIIPAKGASGQQQFAVSKRYQKSTGLILWLIDTMICKDSLSQMIESEDLEQWMPSSDTGEDYFSQVASEHKVIDPRTKKISYELKVAGSANHFYDCEVLQVAAATEEGVGRPEPEEVPQAPTPAITVNRPAWLEKRK